MKAALTQSARNRLRPAFMARGGLRCLLLASTLAAATSSVAAVGQGTLCFGNEPSWSLRFDDERRATMTYPGHTGVGYRGRATSLAPLGESLWRGRHAGQGGDLVALVSGAACSDGMSDKRHPMTVRVSLPDGRFLAGCCRMAQAQATSGFEARTWALIDLPGAPVALPTGRDAPTVRFDGGRVSGFAGCNDFTGSYRLEDGRLEIGTLATTVRACAGPAMALEHALTRALAGSFRVDATDRSLTLASATAATLAFVPATQPKLEGGPWTVTGFNNGRDAVVSPLAGTTLSVAFGDGSVRGSAGCNAFHGSYTASDGRIAIRNLSTTRKLCPREGVMDQEREFLAALELATAFAFERGMLDVHRADGQRALTASRDSP